MTTISKIFKICVAYEQGYGKGQKSSEDENPYSRLKEPDNYEAWNIGYKTAYELANCHNAKD